MRFESYEHFTIEAWKVYRNCNKANWDNLGSAPLNRDSVEKAVKFCSKLYDNLLFCDFSPEPNGDMALDWYGNSYNLLSIVFNSMSDESSFLLISNSISTHRGLIKPDIVDIDLISYLIRAVKPEI